MDDFINRLKSERDTLRDRLKRIETAIDEYEQWARAAAQLVNADKSMATSTKSNLATEEPTPVAEFENEVHALFARVPEPLKRTEVHAELTRQGVIVGGKAPLNTVASRLSRMSGVINLRGHGYWAKDRPYPPAGYPERGTEDHPEEQASAKTPVDAPGADGSKDELF